MSKKIYQVILSTAEYRELARIITTGSHAARVINHARVLVRCHEQAPDATIAEAGRVSRRTAARIRRRYCQEGRLKALTDRPRGGVPLKLSGRAQDELTVIACPTSPEGHVRWTTRL